MVARSFGSTQAVELRVQSVIIWEFPKIGGPNIVP